MQDGADKVAQDEARSWELFELHRQQREAADAAALAELADVLTQLDCNECGTQIPPERLRACPRTRRCVRCASRAEE